MLGYWPGSAVHQRATLAHPRFEDFEYASNDAEELDSLAWMGNGMIMAQELGTSTTGYLDAVDKPPVYVEPEAETTSVGLVDGACRVSKVNKKRKLENGHANGVGRVAA